MKRLKPEFIIEVNPKISKDDTNEYIISYHYYVKRRCSWGTYGYMADCSGMEGPMSLGFSSIDSAYNFIDDTLQEELKITQLPSVSYIEVEVKDNHVLKPEVKNV